jgi:hypothetical protein
MQLRPHFMAVEVRVSPDQSIFQLEVSVEATGGQGDGDQTV